MLLNRLELALMNNPVRAAVQRRFEAPRLLEMGGAIEGGRALEIGCGRGAGVEAILDLFHARSVDAFDLDPRMVSKARARLESRGSSVRLWIGDVTAIPVRDETDEAVFDSGILHHIPDWRAALDEVFRVLKRGGRFYAEEVLARFVTHPLVRRALRHPQEDRFDTPQLRLSIEKAGFRVLGSREMMGAFLWVTTIKA